MWVLTGAVDQFHGSGAGAAQFEAGLIDAVARAGLRVALHLFEITDRAAFGKADAVGVHLQGTGAFQRFHFLAFAC